MEENTKKTIALTVFLLLILSGLVYFIFFRKSAAVPSPSKAQDSAKKEIVKKKELPMFIEKEEFYPDLGKELKARFSVYREKPEVKHGTYNEFYRSGKKLLQCTYKENVAEGPFTFWYENEQKALEGTLKDNKREGTFTEWHTGGKKKLSYSYNNGILDGSYTEFYEDEKPMIEKNYSNGKLAGIYKYFRQDGAIKIQTTYETAKPGNVALPENKTVDKPDTTEKTAPVK